VTKYCLLAIWGQGNKPFYANTFDECIAMLMAYDRDHPEVLNLISSFAISTETGNNVGESEVYWDSKTMTYKGETYYAPDVETARIILGEVA